MTGLPGGRKQELMAKVQKNWTGGPALTPDELDEYERLTGVPGVSNYARWNSAPAKAPAAEGVYGMPDMGGSALTGHSMGGGGAYFNVPKSDIELRKKRAEMEWLAMEMQKREMMRRMNDPYYGSDPGDEIRRLLKNQLSTT